MRNNILVSVLLGCLGLGVFTSCSDDDSAPTNFYASLRMTAAEKISSQPERFSMFKEVLERNNYLSLLSTYGMYTVFAPDNNAMQQYLRDRNYSSVAQLPDALCDTIARMHIVSETAFFSTDMSSKATPINLNDIYLEVTSTVDKTMNNALALYVNKASRIIQKDDSVTNGVVHVVDKVLKASNMRLPDFMEEDPSISIFCEALRKTGIADSLMRYKDETYPEIDPDSTDERNKPFNVKYGSTWDNGRQVPKDQPSFYPAKRFYKFSAFVEKNSVYEKKGIHNLEELEQRCIEWYGSEDLDNPKSRKNPLNKFVSYHIIDRMGAYNEWLVSMNFDKNVGLKDKFRPSEVDPEDFFETLLPHSIIRFSHSAGGMYLNRKGTPKSFTERGILVEPTDQSDRLMSTDNGNYFYIDDILKYDMATRENVLATRIRLNGSVLSPDFMNSGARIRHIVDEKHNNNFMQVYKRGYLTNFDFNEQTTLGLRQEDPTWRHFQGSGVCISGKYDVKIKLPSVPVSGTWEIRLGYTKGGDRGAAQVYLAEVDDNTSFENIQYMPCGIPVDFTYNDLQDMGWQSDSDDDMEYNRTIDKSMRNRGYMKAPLVITANENARKNINDGDSWNTVVRRILVRQTFDANKTYWLRFRQVVDDPLLYMSLDYLEIVPKKVYDDPQGEDWY